MVLNGFFVIFNVNTIKISGFFKLFEFLKKFWFLHFGKAEFSWLQVRFWELFLFLRDDYCILNSEKTLFLPKASFSENFVENRVWRKIKRKC